MMADHSQFELDDELLSAYLDDELSVEERAAVERRLASDLAARQLLEELRHMSQAVRSLPPESIGRDIRMSVLERVQATKEVPLVPPVTIGRSRRGWLWASLAVAAALMIAVFAPDEPEDAELPAVAQHSRELGDHPVMRAAPEGAPEAAPAETAVADATSAPSTSDSFGALAESATGGAAPPSEHFAAKSPATSPLPEEPAMPAPAAAAPVPASETATMRSFEAPAAADEVKAESPEQAPVVVVRVLARRDALSRGTFEQLLQSNGVQIDSRTEEEQAVTDGAADFNDADLDAEQKLAAAEANKSDAQEGVEFLVEAPRDTIFNCVAGLNQDSQNYLGLEVDELSAEEKQAVASRNRRVPPVAPLDDLAKYNRGIVPRRGGEARSRNEGMYYRYDDFRNLPVDSSDQQAATDRVELQPQTAARNSRLNNGRALRLPRYAEPAGGVGGRAQDAKAVTQGLGRAKTMPAPKVLSGLKDVASAGDASMQVLFVLDPSDEPVASPPAENPPQ